MVEIGPKVSILLAMLLLSVYCTLLNSNMLTLLWFFALFRRILVHAVIMDMPKTRELAKFSHFFIVFCLSVEFCSCLFSQHEVMAAIGILVCFVTHNSTEP